MFVLVDDFWVCLARMMPDRYVRDVVVVSQIIHEGLHPVVVPTPFQYLLGRHSRVYKPVKHDPPEVSHLSTHS